MNDSDAPTAELPEGVLFATPDQSKPIFKMINRMLKPKVRPHAPRKSGKVGRTKGIKSSRQTVHFTEPNKSGNFY